MVGLGLGYYSEQAFEAIHYDFLKFEEHCSVSKDHKDYRMKMMAIVQRYNSLHMGYKCKLLIYSIYSINSYIIMYFQKYSRLLKYIQESSFSI